MTARKKISHDIQRKVRERAKFLCEYCHTSEKWQYVRFTIEHVAPLARGGKDTFDNLALACFHCNRRKHIHVTAKDPISGKTVRIFTPRTDKWFEHFVWSNDGTELTGKTDIGRATIELLRLNRQRIIDIRALDVVVNRHPPVGDPVEKTPDETR